MSSSPFLESLNSLPEHKKAELAARYSSWDEQKRTGADDRVRYLQKLGRVPRASSVAEELDLGLEHTACTVFLHTLRQWSESRIKDRLRDITYQQHIDEAGNAAIEKFHSVLSDREQMLVLRAFAIEMMEGFGMMIEERTAYDFGCPVNWTLVNPSTGQQVCGEVHAYFDGDPEDDTYMPRLPE